MAELGLRTVYKVALQRSTYACVEKIEREREREKERGIEIGKLKRERALERERY